MELVVYAGQVNFLVLLDGFEALQKFLQILEVERLKHGKEEP